MANVRTLDAREAATIPPQGIGGIGRSMAFVAVMEKGTSGW